MLAGDGELLQRAGLVLLGALPGEPPEALVVASDLLAAADPAVTDAVAAATDRLAQLLAVPVSHAELAGERIAGWLEAFSGRQLVEAWRAHGAWIEARRPPMGPGVAARFAAARAAPVTAAEPAGAVADAVRAALERILPAGAALVIPAAATVAPIPDLDAEAKEALRRATARLTTIAGLAGAPAVSLPLAEVDGRPVGVSLLGRPGDDERLLAAAARL